MASNVEIANRALQLLGAKRIISLNDDSVNARSCNVAFQPLKRAELEKHTWNFAIKRASLAADSPTPDWGRANSFTLPSDFIKMLPPYPEMNINSLDWQIENGKIYTNDSAPLYIRYVFDVTDPNQMSALFREALSHSIAVNLCEELTQSGSKKESIINMYKIIIEEAKKSNALNKPPVDLPDDVWITTRA